MMQTLPMLETDRSMTDNESGFGTLRTEKGALPLVALDVQTRIDGLIASVEVTQTFVNTHNQPLEATYIFPLPDRAAVTRFRLEVAGRIVEGELQERGQARQTYDRAVQAGHRAAIAEEDRAGVFTMRVGNLPPGERAVVRLAMVGPVSYSNGEATFRFPLVVAPRYIPGAALPGPQAGSGVAQDTDRVPDASRISPPVLLPGFPNPVRLSLSVDVTESLSPHSFRSSLHTVEATKNGFRLEPGERLDRDFVMRWRLAGDEVGTSLVVKPDATGGAFMLTLVPPRHLGEAARPRDIVFVLDRSGSMSGWKMVAARRAVARMVEELTERDRFTVYAFDDKIVTPNGFDGQALVPATDRHRNRAAEFLAEIDSDGGTEMAEPLRKAVAELNRNSAIGTERVLVLITDGQVGNEDEILRSIAPNAANIRIFTLGIDRAVNEAFLRRLANLGRGACEVVESEQRLDEVMDQIHRLAGSPVLTGLSLAPAGLAVVAESVVPSRLPDLFAGTPVVLTGRFTGQANGAVVLRATDTSGAKWAGEVSCVAQPATPIDKVWGRGRVRELEDRYAVQTRSRGELEREIVQVSLACGVLSRFTAYVAVDRAEVVNAGGEQKHVTQAVETPAGWGETEMLMAQMAPEAAESATLAGGVLFGLATTRTRSVPAKMKRPVSAPPAAPCATPAPVAPLPALEAVSDSDQDESTNAKRELTRNRAPKKSMLAKQVLQELNDSGRHSKKTQLAQEAEQTRSSSRSEVSVHSTEALSTSMWDRLKAFFGLDAKAAPDLAACRTRAERVQQNLEAAGTDTAARLAALRASQTELNDLMRDILVIDAHSPEVLELAKQVSGMPQIASDPVSDDMINRYYEGVVLALRAWLGVKDAAAPTREGFWK